MEPAEARRAWQCPVCDPGAVAEMWDQMAEGFARAPVPGGDDPFVRLVRDSYPVGPATSLLDIGCGSGGYTVALARGAGRAVGVDIAPAMIRDAEDLAAACGAGNVRFAVADWNALPPDGPLLRDGFDIVYARLAPAIRSAAAFEKMLGCCRGLGLLTKPAHRHDRVRTAVFAAAGLTDRSDDDDALRYAAVLLRARGLRPRYLREPDVWELDRPVHEVLRYHLAQVRSLMPLTPARERAVTAAVEALADGGIVHERITSVRTTIYWRM